VKTLEKATLNNGTEILLQDWSDKNTEEYPNLYGYCINAYPVAKNTGKYRFIRAGERFLIHIAMNSYKGYTNEMVKSDFEKLKNGELQLTDLADKFWNGVKDQWYLGMEVDPETAADF